MPLNKNLKLPAVMEATGLGRSTIYRLMAEGKFPKSVKTSARAVAWRESDIREFLDKQEQAND